MPTTLWPPLHTAAEQGQVEEVRRLLEADPAAARARWFGRTPLHLAAESGHVEVSALLLEAAPEAALIVNYGLRTPLHSAAVGGDPRLVGLLLESAPAAASLGDYEDSWPLHDAARFAKVAAMQLLLPAAPAAATHFNAHSHTPLTYAIDSGSEAAVRLLLQAAPQAATAADPQTGILPAHRAAAGGRTSMLQLLLETAPEAAWEATDAAHLSRLPLHVAAAQGHADAVRFLLESAPPTAEQRDGWGRLPLELALVACSRRSSRDLFEIDSRAAYLLAHAFHDLPTLLLAAAAACSTAEEMAAGQPGVCAPERTLQAAAEVCTSALLARPLSAEEWGQVPSPCSFLAAALPAVLARSPTEAACLVAHLPLAERCRLHAAALCLAQVERRMGLALPAVWSILAHCVGDPPRPGPLLLEEP